MTYAPDHAVIATSIGAIVISGDDVHVQAIRLGGDSGPRDGQTGAVRQAATQLLEWFAGTRQVFDLPLASAATARGLVLRKGMVDIAYGTTRSYGELSQLLASSPRAIGQACARNPFPIVVPCHRVLGAGNALGAYSAGQGPTTKSWLLEHERRITGEAR